MKFDNWNFFENLSRKFKFHKNLIRITDTLHEDLPTLRIPQWILLRDRNVSNKICTEPKTKFVFGNFFFRKSCRLWNNVEEYGRVRHAAYENTILCMRTAWRIPWPQTHTQNMYYLLLFHGNNSYANAPQCYVYKNIACLVDNVLTLTFVHPILM
jgi:hypothetical protein